MIIFLLGVIIYLEVISYPIHIEVRDITEEMLIWYDYTKT